MQIKLIIASLAALAVANPLAAPVALPEVEDVVVARDNYSGGRPGRSDIDEWRNRAKQYADSHCDYPPSPDQINQARTWWTDHWNSEWDNGLWPQNLWQWHWLYTYQVEWHAYFETSRWWDTCHQECEDVWNHVQWL